MYAPLSRNLYLPRLLPRVIRQVRWVSSSPRETDLAEGNLAGTVVPHHRHLMLCTGTHQWPSHPEMAWPDRLFGKFIPVRRSLMKSGSPILFSLTDMASKSEEGEDLMVFPDGIRLEGLKISDVPRVEKFLSQPASVPMHESLDGLQYSKLPGKHIFICTHGERDCRCGEKGGELHEALCNAVALENKAKGRSDIHIHRISHIGGHKYAANAILYPSGNWYGHLRADQAHQVIQTLLGSHELQDHWRGRIRLTKEEQISLSRENKSSLC
ncbi:MAG: Sucrase/ferredoxin-like-domain-containing protein [Piptocephalis tieghemiana]|nr:MAG: Sucrase/ferredoxin-like-domain-containing protein [Piptocephalis tieghemiana]